METKRINWTIGVTVCVLVLDFCTGSVFAFDSPISGESGGGSSPSASSYTDLVETTDDDPNWVLVVSDVILRENYCGGWFEKILDPCVNYYNRYWKLAPGQLTGEAFKMDILLEATKTMDSLYVPAGYYFQLYNNPDPNHTDDWVPYGPFMRGPQYVSIDYWRDDPRTEPNYFEPNTFFVEGEDDGALTLYSILIYHYDPNLLTKTDGIDDDDCRSPGDEITYTLCWDNDSDYTFEDCYILDYLPEGVDYPGAGWTLPDPNAMPVPPDTSYDPNTHSYRWDIGSILPYDADCVTLDVEVNGHAEPGHTLHNIAELWGTVYDPNGVPYTILISSPTEDTRVCCWGDPNNIYVDWTAEGDNNGTSWTDAYTNLADALRRTAEPNCVPGPNTIYVAQGIYDPNETPELTFALPDGVSVYGGFKSGGCSFAERNPKKYETILTGLIDEETLATSVVTMGDESLVDGFTVTQALENAVYGSGVNFSIENCTVQESYDYGIYAINGNVTIKWCKILLNNSSTTAQGFGMKVQDMTFRWTTAGCCGMVNTVFVVKIRHRSCVIRLFPRAI